MMIMLMYVLLFVNYILMGTAIGGFIIRGSYVDIIMAIVHLFIGLAMQAGIEQAKEEDEDNDDY
jgi:Flp pilus assembly protein CpaB